MPFVAPLHSSLHLPSRIGDGHNAGMPPLAPLAAAALSALAIAAVASPRNAGDPESVVRHLYEVKRAEVAQWKAPPRAPGKRAAFAATASAFKAAISRKLAEAIEKDARSAEGGPGRFNADPLLWGQEFDDDVLHDLRVALLQRSEVRARVRAQFTNTVANESGPVEVLFELCFEGGRWRIEDIRSAGASLVAILTGP
jgi:hypothetical protein